jgi:hypothetical protein
MKKKKSKEFFCDNFWKQKVLTKTEAKFWRNSLDKNLKIFSEKTSGKNVNKNCCTIFLKTTFSRKDIA